MAEDRRERILGAAFGEFAAKGFRGATIKSIARAAKLQSPALIYHYFEDKEALFREVLSSKVPVLRVLSDPEAVMDLPPEEVLARIGRAYFGFEKSVVKPGLQLMVGEALRRPEVAEVFVRIGPGRVLGFLEKYLQRQVELGRLRPHDVRSSGRAFMGMLIPQLAGSIFLPTLGRDGPTDEEHLRTATEIFLGGLRPEGWEER